MYPEGEKGLNKKRLFSGCSVTYWVRIWVPIRENAKPSSGDSRGIKSHVKTHSVPQNLKTMTITFYVLFGRINGCGTSGYYFWRFKPREIRKNVNQEAMQLPNTTLLFWGLSSSNDTSFSQIIKGNSDAILTQPLSDCSDLKYTARSKFTVTRK